MRNISINKKSSTKVTQVVYKRTNIGNKRELYREVKKCST